MATAIMRLYLKYPVAGSTVLDVTDTQVTVLGDTGGAAVTTIGARVQLFTRARDSKSVWVAADNIAGIETVAGAPAP